MAESKSKPRGKEVFAAAVEASRPTPPASHGGARPGAGRKPTAKITGAGSAEPTKPSGKGSVSAPPPEPMSPEEAGALLRQLDGMVVMVLRTKPLTEPEVKMAGEQLAPVLPGVLAKLTPEAVAIFGLSMLYVPRLVEVWATRKAAEQRRKAGAVDEATATREFPRVVEGAPPVPPRPPTDREALAMGVVADRKDPIRKPTS